MGTGTDAKVGVRPDYMMHKHNHKQPASVRTRLPI